MKLETLDFMPETFQTHSITDLFKIMEKLLSPEGCPWDREQTPQSLAPYAIEEAYELAEALEAGEKPAIVEELGDLLMQVVFHSSLAQKEGRFSFQDVVEAICTKLIRRHPHVFADSKLKTSDEVLKQWDIIKDKEKAGKKTKRGFGIPVALPALQRAQKIGDKTKTFKFDWEEPDEVLKKLDEEIGELKEAILQGQKDNMGEELGDVFFVLAQLARHLKLEAETTARLANQKFEKRFEYMMVQAQKKGLSFSELPSAEKESLWDEAKKKTKS